MTRIRGLVLFFLLAVPIVGVYAVASLAHEPAAPAARVQDVELIGYQVFSSTGTWLGEVDGVLTNASTGTIEYVVLSYRVPRVYGLALMVTDPRRYLPIPWRLFATLPDAEELAVDADEMALITAPYLVEDPESLSPETAHAIDHYWQAVAGAGD